MNFEYTSVGSTSSTVQPITLAELGTIIATDWVPGIPPAISASFADLLSTMTEEKGNRWTVRTKMAGLEKQWKQVTSWILGLAFCRKVLQIEGYPWWAPVSAFTSRGRRRALLTTYWQPSKDCLIKKPKPALSRFLPDYVVARRSALG